METKFRTLKKVWTIDAYHGVGGAVKPFYRSRSGSTQRTIWVEEGSFPLLREDSYPDFSRLIEAWGLEAKVGIFPKGVHGADAIREDCLVVYPVNELLAIRDRWLEFRHGVQTQKPPLPRMFAEWSLDQTLTNEPFLYEGEATFILPLKYGGEWAEGKITLGNGLEIWPDGGRYRIRDPRKITVNIGCTSVTLWPSVNRWSSSDGHEGSTLRVQHPLLPQYRDTVNKALKEYGYDYELIFYDGALFGFVRKIT